MVTSLAFLALNPNICQVNVVGTNKTVSYVGQYCSLVVKTIKNKTLEASHHFQTKLLSVCLFFSGLL
jgi:hypothetical protein